MAGHKGFGAGARKRKVAVPIEVRRAAVEVLNMGGGQDGLARKLGVSDGVARELLAAGGAVQPAILERVRARLKELLHGVPPSSAHDSG